MNKLISNVEYWDLARSVNDDFRRFTSEGTKQRFDEVGFNAIKNNLNVDHNDFFKIILGIVLEGIDVAQVKDKFEMKGFGRNTTNQYGGIIHRRAVGLLDPVSPAYLGLEDGEWVNPYIIRKGVPEERFWKKNFDFQNFITIPFSELYKDAFTSAYGMDEMISGMIESLQKSYIAQKYFNKKEAINAFLNSTDDPLKSTQVYEVEMGDDVISVEEAANFILTMKNVFSLMDASPFTDAFNTYNFKSAIDTSKLKLLIRPGIRNSIEVNLLSNAYNQSSLSLPLSDDDIIEVADFGGITYYADEEYTQEIYMVYAEDGSPAGFSLTEGSETPDYDGPIFKFDPNEDVIAIVAESDLVFSSEQNNITISNITNPRGMYTNYFFSAPGNTVAVDPIKNAVVFKKVKKD